jgi:hypothetical protein
MHTLISLTVSESKRLIAKGVAAYEPIRRAVQEGIVAISSGSTNGYVIEELTGERIDKKTMVTGRTLPSGYSGPTLSYTGEDLILRRGERIRGVRATQYINEMGPGDVFVKGANALNYERQQAAVLIGHPTGGTIGAVIGPAIARRLRFLHPVGLEKSLSVDLVAVAERINADPAGKGPTLWLVPGEIFTEIEALAVLAGVEAVPAGAGGLGGAEGAVWLALFGTVAELAKAQEILAAVHGEPPFTAV